MRLTVLGRWSPYPPAGGASPGYLVEAGTERILLDCGTGVLANLQRLMSVFDLTAIVVTHLHPDHVLDLFAVKQALRFGRLPDVPLPVPLYAPGHALEVLPMWMEETSRAGFRERFSLHALEDGIDLPIGSVRLRAAMTRHSILCFAARLEHDGRVLAYSADTGPSDAVGGLASRAHLFLCESTLAPEEEAYADEVGHLSARLAGQMAAGAGVRRLLLTHFWAPRGEPGEEAREAAAKELGREVLIARELESHQI